MPTGEIGADRRVRRTRAALNAAVVDLIVERGYDAVTVQDIIERADVGRSTFYAHYKDKDDLLLGGIEVLRPMIDSRSSDRLLGFSLELFRHARSHRRFHRAVVGRRAGNIVLKWLTSMVADLVRQDLARFPQRPTASIPPELLVQFVAGAYMSVLTAWLTADDDVGVEEVDRFFRTLVVGGLTAVIDPTEAQVGTSEPARAGRRTRTARGTPTSSAHDQSL